MLRNKTSHVNILNTWAPSLARVIHIPTNTPLPFSPRRAGQKKEYYN